MPTGKWVSSTKDSECRTFNLPWCHAECKATEYQTVADLDRYKKRVVMLNDDK